MQKYKTARLSNLRAIFRRYSLLTFVLTAGVFSARSAKAQCFPAPSGLIAWWPGDGNATDMFGGFNGTLQSGAIASAVGMVSQSFEFDGTNGYVSIPDAPALRPANLTVEFWVRWNSLNSPGTSQDGQQYLVFKQNTRNAVFEGYAVYKRRLTNPTRDVFTFGVSSADGSPVEAFGTTSIAAGTWYHVAAVRGPDFARIYVNGQLQAEMPVSFPQDYGNFPLYFGTTGQPNWDRKPNARMDEVALYNRVLSTTEIQAIYNAGVAGKCKGLAISSQPQSRTNVQGSTASFAVSATGSPPLTYQWHFNGEALGGATATNLIVSNVQSTNAGNYSVVVTDSGSASLTSSVAVLTVIVPPSFAEQPHSATNDAGTTASFSAIVAGSSPFSYVWQRNGSTVTNGGRFSGANTDTLQISNIQASDAGNYRLNVSNGGGSNSSSIVTLTVTGPPVVQTPPSSQTQTVGGTANFSVVASGTLPMSYQWQRNGVNLQDGGIVSGATTDTLTLTGVTTNDAAGYRVVLTNSVGSVTSVVASLVINIPPIITVQPVGKTAVHGTNVSFSVTATSPSAMGYRWRFNGVNLSNSTQYSGVTTSNLTVNYVLPANAGGYSVVITNSVGSVTSSVASLIVVPPTDCIASPSGLIGWWTGDGNFKDIAGTNHGTYFGGGQAHVPGVVGQAMKFDGTNNYVAIPDSPQLRPQNLTVECWVLFTSLNGFGNSPLLGQQYMVFKNNTRNCNNFEAFVFSKDRHPDSDVFLWEVTSSDGSLIRSDSKTKVTTNTWYHCVGVAGTNYLEMYINGVMETNTTFNFPLDYGNGKPLMFGSSGEACYDRKLHGYLDEVSLWNRALTSNEVAVLYANSVAGKCKGTNGLFITTHPQDRTTNSGSTVSFSTAAVGGTTPGFQWQFNGVNIPGATGSTLVLNNVQAANAGSYRAVVTNASGTSFTAGANLTIFTVPVISSQPTNKTVVAGNGASFAVVASGPALNYQWQFNGSDILNATDATYLIGNAQSIHAGNYSVVITNSSGSATSVVATLTVEPAPICMPKPTGLVSWWRGEGDTNDFVGSNHGIIEDGLTYAPAKVGQGFVFNGTAAALRVPASPSLNVAAGGSFSIELWINPSQVATERPIVEWRNGNSLGAHLWMAVAPPFGNGSGSLFVDLIDTNGALHVLSTAGGLVKTNTQQHVAVTYDRPSGVTVIYLNGTNVAQQNLGSFTPQSSFDLYLGQRQIAVPQVRWAGQMDEISLYNRALLSSEVQGIYQAGTAGKCSSVQLPVVVVQPTNQTVTVAGNVTFNALATGEAPLAYQWRFNGTNLSGQTQTALALSNVQAGQAGGYSVVVTNVGGSVTSEVATLTVLVPPSISTQPTNKTVIAGNLASFVVGAAGTAPLNYQWRFAGTNLPGELASTLNLNNVQVGQAGGYSVVVSNVVGSITSSVATLTVLIPPYFIDQPQAISRPLGSAANFGVTAGGTGPFTYQWKHSGTNLSGATLATLTLNNVQFNQTGGYSVLLTGAAGVTNSEVAVLTVAEHPVLINPSGGNASPFSFIVSGTPGQNYVIQISTNLVNWSDLGIVNAADPQTLFVDPSASGSGTRFYRAKFAQ